MTLLEKAIQASRGKPMRARAPNAEEIELAIAFLSGQVTRRALVEVLGLKGNNGEAATVAILRNALARNLIKIELLPPTAVKGNA